MTVKQAIDTRRSTRYYQEDKKISDKDIETILAAGKKAPNGFGIEPWKFYVLSGDMSKIKEATYGQEHIQNASHVFALVNYKRELVDSDPSVIKDLLAKKGFSGEQMDAYFSKVSATGTQYYREQVMFAASQMVLQATALEIGSVVVGGYIPDKLADVIGLDKDKYEVGIVISFGYPKPGETKPRLTRDDAEVIEYITL